ncbi:MAG: hypothetical protein MHM6MM_001667 [Cercozoa sp. M6MM]
MTRARALTFRGRTTPLCLHQTLNGAPEFLSADLLERLPEELRPRGWQLTDTHFIAKPGSGRSKKAKGTADPSETVQRVSGSVKTFLNFGESLTVACARECGGGHMGPVNKKHLTIATHAGNVRVTPEVYAQRQLRLRPDIVCALSAESLLAPSRNRASRNLHLSRDWLARQCAEFAKVEAEKRPQLFATIQGGSDLECRRVATEQALLTIQQSNGVVTGVLVGGLECGETRAERQRLLQQVVSRLPAEMPRMMNSSGHPLDVLDAVEAGIDLIDCAWPHELTKQGLFATFATDPLQGSSPQSKLNVRDESLSLDTRTLVCEGECSDADLQAVRAMQVPEFAYSRAYVHHLFTAGEMLGMIVLDLHNTMWYERFFAAIRRHIEAGTFVDFRSAFEKQFHD